MLDNIGMFVNGDGEICAKRSGQADADGVVLPKIQTAFCVIINFEDMKCCTNRIRLIKNKMQQKFKELKHQDAVFWLFV